MDDIFALLMQMHRGFAYSTVILVLIFVVFLIRTMFGFSGEIKLVLKKSTFFTMLLFHLQAVIGLAMLFFFSPGFKAAIEAGTLMSNEYNRKTFVEHPASMVIAAILMTIVNKYIKNNDKLALKITIMAFVAVLLFEYALPWEKLLASLQ
ncbi:MAG: hypothetical protein KBA33_00425 [Cloacibacterium sp.]|nr:hypothetical protein [Cloacibacterium sp.]